MTAMSRCGSRLAAIAVCAVVVMLIVAGSAGAHAYLDTSIPGPDSTLGSPPTSLRLMYDEDVVPQYARVAVVTPQGHDLAGAPRVAGPVVVIPLRPGPAGSYTVRWRMVATADGHATEGAFSFGVRARALAPAPAHGVGIPVAPQVLAWLQFLGVVLAGGVLTFRALVLAPAARLLGERGAPDAGAAIWVGVIGAAIGLHAGLFGFLVGSYPIVGGRVADFANTLIIPIRTSTHLGQAWTLTTFAWLGVLGLLVGACVTPRRREPLLAAAGVVSLAIAFGISWASHPASHGTLALIADYVHLLAGAVWVGALVALVIVALASRSAPLSAREAVARASILRFSKLALPTVAVVGLAGLYLALRELPGPSALVSSGYGVTLLVKSAVVLCALAIAGYHRRFVVPQLAAERSMHTIRRTLAFELGFLLTVLALAAILSQSAPPA
jgi:copper transport protein